MSDAAHTRALVQDVFAALHDHDLVQVEALLHEDATLTDAATGKTYRGPDAIVETMRPVLAAFPDLTPEIINLVVEGTQAVAEVVRTGTHTEPLSLPDGELAPTGKEVELPECLVLRMKDEKVAAITAYTDRLVLREQLGLIET